MKLKQIPINQIVPADKHKVRHDWSEEEMDNLAASLADRGLIQPAKVRPTDDPDTFELIAGHRRVEAAKRAGLKSIPCIVDDVDDIGALLEAYSENVSRESMSPIDEAKALKRIQDATGWSQREMQRRGLGTQSWISNRLGLLEEPQDIQDIIVSGGAGHVGEGKVTERHVRYVRLAVGDDEKARVALLNKAAMETLTSEQTDKVAKAYAEAGDDETRQAILEVSYHDPAWNQLVSAKAGVIRREKAKPQKPHNRSVKSYLSALGEFRESIKLAHVATREGLFSPEAMALVRRWQDDIIEKMMELDEIYKET